MPVDHRITGGRARGLNHELGIVEPRRRRQPKLTRAHLRRRNAGAERSNDPARARRRRVATRKVADVRTGRGPLEPSTRTAPPRRARRRTRAERVHDGLPPHPGPLSRALDRLGESDRVVGALAQKPAQPASSEHGGGPTAAVSAAAHTPPRATPWRAPAYKPAQPATSEHGGGLTAATLGSSRATRHHTAVRASLQASTARVERARWRPHSRRPR